MTNNEDFIATELLSELKRENERKDKQVKRLQVTLLAVVLVEFLILFSTVGVFLWYLNQYDFSGTSTVTNEYATSQSAEGVYAFIDSEGNVIGRDLSTEQVDELMETVADGESNNAIYPPSE